MPSVRPVTIPGASEHVISSPGLGDYLISVAASGRTVHTGGAAPQIMPAAGPDAKCRPAVYVVDGNTGFPFVYQTGVLLRPERLAPNALFVGIGYDDIDLPEDWMRLRTRDLTPTADHAGAEWMSRGTPGPVLPDGGGADAFIDFIIGTVKPFIEETYAADPEDATLCGYSFGGLFALHTMFTRPGVFRRYLVGSPSIWWGKQAILGAEAEYAAAHTDLAARVFLSVGGLEGERMTSGLVELDTRLRSRNYPSLQLTTHVFEDETHNSALPATFSRGLRAIFAR